MQHLTDTAKVRLHSRAITSESYFVLLRAALARVAEIQSKRFAVVGLTLAEFAVLGAIHDSYRLPPTVSDLAEILGIDRKSIDQTVKQLIARGLLVADLGKDRRKRLVRMTAQGKARFRAGWNVHRSSQRSIRRLLSTDDRDSIRVVLRSLLAADHHAM